MSQWAEIVLPKIDDNTSRETLVPPCFCPFPNTDSNQQIVSSRLKLTLVLLKEPSMKVMSRMKKKRRHEGPKLGADSSASLLFVVRQPILQLIQCVHVSSAARPGGRALPLCRGFKGSEL